MGPCPSGITQPRSRTSLPLSPLPPTPVRPRPPAGTALFPTRSRSYFPEGLRAPSTGLQPPGGAGAMGQVWGCPTAGDGAGGWGLGGASPHPVPGGRGGFQVLGSLFERGERSIPLVSVPFLTRRLWRCQRSAGILGQCHASARLGAEHSAGTFPSQPGPWVCVSQAQHGSVSLFLCLW